MNIFEQPLGTLSRTIPGATQVFHRHHLDFCCGGHQSLLDAAHDRGLDPTTIANQLKALQQVDDNSHEQLDTPETLIPHILEHYHERHRQQLPELIRLAGGVELVHINHPDCPTGLTDLLRAMYQTMESHMLKEENVLFPMLLRHQFEHSANPIAMMRYEHDQHGEALQQLEHLTTHLSLPNDACDTWQALYWQLDWFRADLMEHIHLENNILFDYAQCAREHNHV